MQVIVTEFIAPNGRQVERSVTVPDDCAVGYEALRRKGCRLTVETLMTGHVSQCIEHEEGDYDINISRDAGHAHSDLAKMIRAFDPVEFNKWLRNVTSYEYGEEEVAF